MRSEAQRRHARVGPRRRYRAAAGVLGSLLSVAIIVVSGASWYVIHALHESLNTSDALGGGPRSTDGSVNILLIGLDSRRDLNGNDLPASLLDMLHVGSSSDVGGYNTNTLILLHIPRGGGTVTGFSIPRDDWVDVPGHGMKKIKQAYGLAKADAETQLVRQGVSNRTELETRSRDAGRQATLRTVEELTGVPIDHFAEVNLVSFYDLANALGGVQVCLNHPVHDAQYSGAVFPAGVQTLDGLQALKFVRQRHGLPDGDLDRTRRQQAFLSSAVHKLDSEGTFGDIGRLRALLAVAKRDVVVDAGWDVLPFLEQARNLTGGKVQFYTLPIEGYAVRDGQDVNLVDPVRIKQVVHVTFGGTAPPPLTALPPSPAGVQAIGPGERPASLDVLNGSGRDGLARRLAAALTGPTLSRGRVANTSPQGPTTVSYGAGAEAAARTVAAQLGNVAIVADPALPAGTVRIVLGESFTAPAWALAPRAPAPRTTSGRPRPAATSASPAGPRGGLITGDGVPCVN